MSFFTKDTQTSLEAIEYSQHIAFAPIVFQATRALRNLGILSIIESHAPKGISFEDIQKESSLSDYGTRVLVEAGLGIGLLTFDNNVYKTTKAAYFILNDEMTIANMDFVHDICYLGMFELEESIVKGKPEGLKTLGNWTTVYEGLSKLKPQEQKSWFAFDHFYSSDSFPKVLPIIFATNPKRILDIGGNTGKWSIACLEHSPEVLMGIVDLPGQLNMAKANIDAKGFTDRLSYYEKNILNTEEKLPKGFDIIWMSQFLDCFSENEIVSILTRCNEALSEDGQVIIMEPFWDTQKYKSSAFSLQMTSLYFTNIANGNSQMYHSGLFTQLVEKSGLTVVERIDNIGVSHSLLKCKKK